MITCGSSSANPTTKSTSVGVICWPSGTRPLYIGAVAKAPISVSVAVLSEPSTASSAMNPATSTPAASPSSPCVAASATRPAVRTTYPATMVMRQPLPGAAPRTPVRPAAADCCTRTPFRWIAQESTA
ncbi:hypothetical protein G5V59_21595 [Nocardioides sp. W3-2-3]|nr:hypothetical protein [Nocardioides convexus]